MNTTTSLTIVSEPSSAKASSIHGNSYAVEGSTLFAQEAPVYSPTEGGSLRANSSRGKAPADAKKLSSQKPLSRKQRALILGSLLGDGSMNFSQPQNGFCKGRFRMNHSSKQEAYCRYKAQLLEDYVNTPAQIVPNLGYGEESCVFATLLTPVLWEFNALCYLENPEASGKFQKHVTQAWVDQLTWEAVAWWFMDDGARQANHIQISTHSFSLEEVQRLADWLTRNGCPARPHKTRRGPKKEYWVLIIPTESAKVFREKVMPYMHHSMLYKLDFEERKEFTCKFCGTEFRQEGGHNLVNPLEPCCSARVCKSQRNAARSAKWHAKIGMKELYQRQLKRNEANPEKAKQARAAATARQQKRFEDPEYREKMNAWKREYRAKRKAAGLPRA